MARIITVLTLLIALVLFPPATLALISNNAVPGDTTYPIKRFLEDRIYDVVSLNPVSKAWFAAARSDRRFQEVKVLVNLGKQAKVTLRELVSQAETTVDEISKVEDVTRKNQLLDQYQETIEEYKEGLKELKQQAISTPPLPTATPIPTPTPITKPLPTPTSAPGISTPTPTKGLTPTPSPTPAPAVSAPDKPTDPDDIENAIDDLEGIGK